MNQHVYEPLMFLIGYKLGVMGINWSANGKDEFRLMLEQNSVLREKVAA